MASRADAITTVPAVNRAQRSASRDSARRTADLLVHPIAAIRRANTAIGRVFGRFKTSRIRPKQQRNAPDARCVRYRAHPYAKIAAPRNAGVSAAMPKL